MQNKKGNVAMIAIIIAIVAGAAGVVSWMFAKKSQPEIPQQNVSQSVLDQSRSGSDKTVTPIVDNTEYINNQYGFKVVDIAKTPFYIKKCGLDASNTYNPIEEIVFARNKINACNNTQDSQFFYNEATKGGFLGAGYIFDLTKCNKAQKDKNEISFCDAAAKITTSKEVSGLGNWVSGYAVKSGNYLTVFSKSDFIKQSSLTSLFNITTLDNKVADLQTYTNTKLGFGLKYPADWAYVSQNDETDFSNGYLFLKKGHENVTQSANPANEIGSVSEYLELNSLVMDANNFKGFNPKEYVVRGFGPYAEELVKWEEKTTTQGNPLYFYTTKIKDKNLDELKEGSIFVNNKERKIIFLERQYAMNGLKISDGLRKTLQDIAFTIIDMQN